MLSLAKKFALAGGFVMGVATLAVGQFVTQRIEDVVVRNTGNATALYMESFVSPLTQEMGSQDRLSPAASDAIRGLLEDTPLGKRVLSFKIWRKDGVVAEASNPELVGQSFEITDSLRQALQGEVAADFEDIADLEDAEEHGLNIPLLEIYVPVRENSTGEIIAVAEFYESAVTLKTDLVRVRLASWIAVFVVMSLIFLCLFIIVLKGSRTIDRQLVALKDLSQHNVDLRMRVQNAAARFSALNDRSLRRIGADLHDGPAQLMAFAALRLDALKPDVTGEESQRELAEVQRAVKDAIQDVRNISRGLQLPDIEKRSLEDVVRNLVEEHAARTGSPVHLVINLRELPEVAVAAKICVFRFVQEGLTNAWRHAEGKGQEVRLRHHKGMLEVVVLDRGPGFAHLPPVTPLDAEGMGLAGLVDRVESLGGHLEARNRDERSGHQGAELAMTLAIGPQG